MEENLKKEIIDEYIVFVLNNGQKPNIATVKVHWKDDNFTDNLTQEIVLEDALDSKDAINDDDILYYCSNINNLLELTQTYDISDFKIVSFLGFERA